MIEIGAIVTFDRGVGREEYRVVAVRHLSKTGRNLKQPRVMVIAPLAHYGFEITLKEALEGVKRTANWKEIERIANS